ncbi:Na(+)/H(+) antiporter subunit A [Microbulbifer flavimaris]|uniref:Na(+)/H(+) antiporter subunit A n=1 Tax=Microbulbifer flavimaris TaxID=1781068 RepID=A0ABX4HZN3_9GAMM|nr:MULTISPECIES: putative monovalent cation/H+ antiporter subunit A [Microbulbifer]KUJ83458.1 cation:proton antiporter [Microbulbifer sp. ZGT114]PCO05615.1 Na(+)/H(+) antiporter subunit A [Microbulbifer flavimaris]
MTGHRDTEDAEPRQTLIALVAPLVPAAITLLLLTQLPRVMAGEVLTFGWAWVPSLGISANFFVDGLSSLFALLISGIGVFVAIYAGSYLSGHPHLRRFYLYLLLFMIGMLGLVMAADLITLFVFWELTTISSYLLIGFNHSNSAARRSALQALLITALGGLCLLAGLILLGITADTFDLREILTLGEQVRASTLYVPILILVLLGAFTKSAQLPFHFWLPNAMAAPTPVSAYLHSATMVKAGIYLLARLHPVLAYTEAWQWTLTLVGAATAVVAAVLALRQTDLKLKLAYTTVVALGTVTMFLGAEASVAIAAAVTFILVHSFYKAALFMLVGIIDHRTGTRELDQLGGLRSAMPITCFVAAAAALSMAGFPPFLGFIGKELKYEGALAIASEPLLVAGAAVFANALMVAVAGTVVLKPFFGQRRPADIPVTEAPPGLWLGPLVLSGLGLAFGVATPLVADTLIQPAVTAILGRPEVVKMKLWHGINLPLILSLLTFTLGILVYLAQRPIRAALAAFFSRLPLSGDRAWDRLLEGLKTLAAVQTNLLQHGVMRRYLTVIFATVAAALGFVLLRAGEIPLDIDWPQLTIKEWAALALTLAGALVAATARAPLAAICALGALGVGLALIYLFFGAPDVAITQLLVETLFLVLVATTLHRLPVFSGAHNPRFRPLDALLALFVGALVTVSILAVMQTPFDATTSEYFERTAVPEAYGRNIVNVILVDFRALDTFGEIVVVFTAAIAAATLIGHRLRRKKS